MLVNFALFGRFFLEFAMMYPAEYLCLASLQEHLRAPRKTYAIGVSVITLMSLAGAAVCSMLDIETNLLLIPLLIISFWLLRWRTDREVSISQTMFLFSVSAVMMSVCTLLAVVLNAEAELDNALPVFLPSTSVICLTLSVILSTIFRFTAVRWSRWLLQEYHGEAFWESAWPLPALYAAFLVFCMPKEIGIVLMNRIRIIAVLAVSISLLGIFLLLYEMYRVAREFTRNARLDRENQLLAMESRRYMELQTYLDNTRRLRHDFRQHLHVIAGLTETGQLEELKSYLHQYESELSEHRPSLCANAAVDALAGYYDHAAGQQSVPVEWKLALPRQLPMPEADLCTILGNLLENALHAGQHQKQAGKPAVVETTAYEKNGRLFVQIANSCSFPVQFDAQGVPTTSQPGHGLGVRSICAIVEQYGGMYSFARQQDQFVLRISL